MGLDNYPADYPCTVRGTVIYDDQRRIDCDATKAAGGCPWLSDPTRPAGGHVIGMFGTSCWYRGKWGNALVGVFVGGDNDFFGDNDDATRKSPDSCLALADAIDAALTRLSDADLVERAAGADMGEEDPAAIREYLGYASWYARWAAAEGNGLKAWY